MSLTDEAYEIRRWHGLEALQRLLSGKHGKPGYQSSVAYHDIERISDLLRIADLCDVNLRGISIRGLEPYHQVLYELHRIEQELRKRAEAFQSLSQEMQRVADSIRLEES